MAGKKIGKKARKSPKASIRRGTARKHTRVVKKKSVSPARAIIWFVRHGQAEGNLQHLFAGSRIDRPLTNLGAAQAGYFAAHFPHKPFAILASPLKRAMQTAKPLAERFGMEIIPLPLAKEQDYGKLSGKRREQLLKPKYKHYFYFAPNGAMYTVKAPWGESWEDMKKRASLCLRWLDRHYNGKQVVVVSHSDFINCAYGVRRKLKNEQVWLRHDVPNCGIVRF